MLGQIVRRILIAVPTLLVVVAAAFALMLAAPGGPFASERNLPPQIEKRLKEKFGLNLPLDQQIARYVGNLVRGDLGPSMKYKDKDVSDIIAEGLPTSALLGASAMVLALTLGGALGVAAALGQNRAQDYAVMGLALVGICLPALVIGPLLQLLFGINLNWLPSTGLRRDEISLPYLVLPVATLALPHIAVISRLMRASMIEAMRSNAIRTARAKGLPEAQVVWRHALPAAVLPIVSYLGPATAGILTGSFVVEKVFALPGLGGQFITAALNRDYTVVMGVILVYAALIIAFNLIADLLYGALDPKARHA